MFRAQVARAWSWEEPVHDAGTSVAFRVWRREPGGWWEQLGKVASGTWTFLDRTAEAGVAYQYQVTVVLE